MSVEVTLFTHDGWRFQELGDRCANKWRCRILCACHRMSDDERTACIAAHTTVEAWTRQVPHSIIQEKRGSR